MIRPEEFAQMRAGARWDRGRPGARREGRRRLLRARRQPGDPRGARRAARHRARRRHPAALAGERRQLRRMHPALCRRHRGDAAQGRSQHPLRSTERRDPQSDFIGDIEAAKILG
ncbi:MAG: hypothetical protein WDM81_13750 [Rhizomicrobium sp.]